MKNSIHYSFFNSLLLAASLGLLLFTSGCFDTKEEFTINPDGSGKVVHECTFQPMNLGSQPADPEETLRRAIRELLEQSKGIDAWRDVSFKTLDDGRLFFRGTAYFKDLSKLDIQNQTMLQFDWQKTASGGGLLDLRTNKSGAVTGQFPVEGGSVTVGPAKPAETPSPKLSGAELTKKIQQERIKFQQAKPMLTGILGSMKQTVAFHLPGKITRNSNFGEDSAADLTLKFDGAKLLETMETLMNNDEWCRKHAGAGFDMAQQGPPMDDEINQVMFGEKGPVSAVVARGSGPLFDYAKEVSVAKVETAKLTTELAVSKSEASALPVAPPAQGGALKSVKVVGVRLVTESDQKRDLRPFNYDAQYSVAVQVEFPGAIQSVTDESEVDTALADDGSSLLPSEAYNRKVHFPHLSADKTAAILELRLKVPGPGIKGLKVLAGRVSYLVASGTKEVDLGFNELKAGATGTELGAHIESIQDGWQHNGSQTMQLRLNTKPDGLKSLSLVVDATRIPLQQNGYGGGGNSYTFTYEYKQAFPATGRLVAEVYDNLQAFETPFKLQNITLLGSDSTPQ